MNLSTSLAYIKNADVSVSFENDVVASLFKQSFPGDLFQFELSGATEASPVSLTKDIVEKITVIFGDQPQITCFEDSVILLRIAGRFLLEINAGGPGDIWDSGYRTVVLSGFGGEQDIVAARAALKTLIRRPNNSPPTIRWHYTSNGMRSSATMPLEKPKPVFDTFYPWIDGGLTAYFNRFADSDDVVLVLLGEPGTGKTSFIRHLLWHLRWNCAVTYDSQLLGRDDLFVNFITNTDDQVMVVEDADVFLTSRERDRNDMMARLLTSATACIKQTDKKLIFTGNITQAGQIVHRRCCARAGVLIVCCSARCNLTRLYVLLSRRHWLRRLSNGIIPWGSFLRPGGTEKRIGSGSEDLVDSVIGKAGSVLCWAARDAEFWVCGQ